MIRAETGVAGLGLIFVLASPLSLGAQDMEVEAEMRGVALPPSYYAAVAANPRLFTLPNGLFGLRSAAGVAAPSGVDGAGLAAAPARAPVSGSATVPVILALFSDSEEPGASFSHEEVARVLFSGPAPRGTLTEAYEEMIAPAGPFEVMKIRSFSVPVRIAGGRGPYAGVGDLPTGFSLEPRGDELVLEGSVREEGPYDFTYFVRDASGDASNPVTVQVSAPIDWTVEEADLLDPFLTVDSRILSLPEQAHLDELGNGNGRYDVGDLRMWLRENR